MKANPNYSYLKEKVDRQRITLLQGGTRSGKTFATIYYLIGFCLKYSSIEIDIVRDTFTALKATAWKDFEDVLTKCNLYDERNHNKSDHTYTLNGNLISYYGADTPDKIHGRSRDILWINEAHQFPQKTIDQLFPRTRHKIICDYNPALGTEHWLDQYILQYPPLITTYRDNPFLTASQIEDIESRKNNEYWWKVYGSGERSNREGAIFDNWSVGEFDTSLPFIFGLDFGFSIDPTALVKVAVDTKKKIIYADELIYKPKLTTDQIADIMPKGLVIADNAEPRLIHELRAKGINIQPCVKGADSVRAGIVKMLDYQIVITKSSTNLAKEMNNYCWSDRKSNTPIDAYNHIIDALRYACDRLLKQSISYAPSNAGALHSI
jgi:phage terminase large subunit